MSTPIPAPRTSTTEGKTPIPAPRHLVPVRPPREREKQRNANTGGTKELIHVKENVTHDIANVEGRSELAKFSKDEAQIENTSNNKTFTRRVKTLSTASKQIAEDIGEKMQEGKKAVLETTRQSVRRITKKFSSVAIDQPDTQTSREDDTLSDASIDIFRQIQFDSPICERTQPQFFGFDEDDYNTPPPPYPPPPLREESVYDEPQSVASGSTNSSGSERVTRTYDYESIFPPYNYSDSDTCVESTINVEPIAPIKRSGSWKFYDQVPKQEQLYNNVDNTPTLEPMAVSTSQNSMEEDDSPYENHVLNVDLRDLPTPRKPTNTLIMQFDPMSANTKDNVNALQEGTSSNTSHLRELMQFEQTLQQELYSNMGELTTLDNWSISNESEIEEFINPPTPPARFDSLPEESASPIMHRKESASPNMNRKESKTSWYTGDSATEVEPTAPNTRDSVGSVIGRNLFKQINDVFKKAPQFVKNVKTKEMFLDRPSISARVVNNHKGMLYRVTNGPVEDLFGEFSSRWCVLEDQAFLCHQDNTCNTVKENIPLASILSVQILQDQKYKYKHDNDDIHCFEINTADRSRGGYVFGSRGLSERRVWLQKLAEGLSIRFGPKIISDYTRLGWAYIKEGVNGEWIGAWLILCNRMLCYITDSSPMERIDLRKVRGIMLHSVVDSDNSPKTTDKGPNLLLDCPSGTIYMRMWTSRETKVWCHIIKIIAHNNGANLDQQQLTKNDVPVLVEKCINFVYVYGSMSEGIYRRSGSSSNILDILLHFRNDAWSAQLDVQKYNEHDVANALKRFFRDLPEPVLTNNKRQYFHQVSLIKSNDEKIRMYRAAFDQFHLVTQNTVRKLIGHLHFISTQNETNFMTIENLASVWGPTLMQSKTDVNQDRIVVSELIKFYHYIFPENQAETDQERIMLTVLKKYSSMPHGQLNNTKTSGDLRMWIYLNNRKGRTYHVAIGPQKTAYDVCAELSSKMATPAEELVLEENVLNDNLFRPLHFTEKVLDVVLKWSYWDEVDRKDNCLVLTTLKKYRRYLDEKSIPVPIEMRYADSKSRNFKTFMFEFSQANLSYYKDKQQMQLLGSWKVEDITFYIGNEPRRNVPFKYTVTFINKDEVPNRTKISPWFGNVLVWSSEIQRVIWVSGMWKATYPHNLTPPPQHVNLFSS